MLVIYVTVAYMLQPQIRLSLGCIELVMNRSTLPRHVGLIPDGNRRWATQHGLSRESGYFPGVTAGLELYDKFGNLGIEEVSVYGFTKDNTKRPPQEVAMFKKAVVEMAHALHDRGAALLIVGDSQSKQFPEELKPFLTRTGSGLKINILANYGWDWDLDGLRDEGKLRSSEVSRIDLVVRWGGARRLSGFLPAQSVYADFYVIDDYWPQYKPEHIQQALDWFKRQDRTFGG